MPSFASKVRNLIRSARASRLPRPCRRGGAARDAQQSLAADRLRRQARGLRARFGFVERGHRGFGARRRPEPHLALKAIDEFEEQRRAEFQRLFLAFARRLAGTRKMKALEMAELGTNETHRLGAFAERAVERALELCRIALGRGKDRFIRRQLGAVADSVECGGLVDRAAVADIKRELLEL